MGAIITNNSPLFGNTADIMATLPASGRSIASIGKNSQKRVREK